MKKPSNDYEALVLGLELAITAPTKKESLKALAMAEQFAAQLSKQDVERAKSEVKKILKIDD